MINNVRSLNLKRFSLEGGISRDLSWMSETHGVVVDGNRN
jgi:hypothetical protein